MTCKQSGIQKAQKAVYIKSLIYIDILIIQHLISVAGDNIFLSSLIYYEVVYANTDAIYNNMNSKFTIIKQTKIT